MSNTPDPAEEDSGIRVIVTPSQSSYFAGEVFSVTITLTNIRSPESLPVRIHKRGAHSISSAPLARPPTSPGTPRTASPALTARRADNGAKTMRRGLIGKGVLSNDADGKPEFLEYSRKRLLARSLSVDIVPPQLHNDGEHSGKGLVRVLDDMRISAPNSPAVSSPLTRSVSQGIPSNHPHARKQSVSDLQLQLQEMQSPSPYTHSPFSSTHSLHLDPIAESGPLSPSSVRISSSSAMESGPSMPVGNRPHQPGANGHASRPPHLGLGRGPPPLRASSLNTPRTATSSNFPPSNSELILYSYAQLRGTVTVTPSQSLLDAQQQRALSKLRTRLLHRSVIGGGSMDITSSLYGNSQSPFSANGRRVHSRTSSLYSGLNSLISTARSSVAIPSSSSWTSPYNPKSSASLSGFFLSSPPVDGLLGGDTQEQFDPEQPLPTFDVQPSMLAVDLELKPGESRTYSYAITLPALLPPTFRGRCLRFDYEFVVGTCRAGSSTPLGGSSANSISRVMKVPIRVYNNVVVGQPPKPYDLLWPVAKRKGTDSIAQVVENPSKPFTVTAKFSQVPHSPVNANELQEYARQFLPSRPDASCKELRTKTSTETISPSRDGLEPEEDPTIGCREAVEILTRTTRKVSYDVNKDGVKVAVLTFTKSAYRLGETILGVVELNERRNRARVLKLSVILEAHESLPVSISGASDSRRICRVHAEHHASFVLSAIRTTFSLDIPPDTSPAFQILVDDGDSASNKPTSLGGLEWKVRLCLLVAMAAESSDAGAQGIRVKHLLRDGPRGQWGSSWIASASIAPMERPDRHAVAAEEQVKAAQAQTWSSFITSSLLGFGNESAYHDGDEIIDDDEENEADLGGGDSEWQEVKLETVECEVPIRVWPGNTLFRAMDVVFDV